MVSYKEKKTYLAKISKGVGDMVAQWVKLLFHLVWGFFVCLF